MFLNYSYFLFILLYGLHCIIVALKDCLQSLEQLLHKSLCIHLFEFGVLRKNKFSSLSFFERYCIVINSFLFALLLKF